MGRNWIKKIRIAVRRDERWKYNKAFLIEQSGRRAENKTGRALNELIKKGKIKGYRQTERYSQEDMQGIDFIILSLRGNHIFLQIKSFLYPSDKKALRLKEIMMGIWWHETGIYNIEARIDEKPNHVAEKILRILEFEDKKFQERKETYLALDSKVFYLSLFPLKNLYGQKKILTNLKVDFIYQSFFNSSIF